jgi:anaerobic selenocysteine-containing dehydrogenase
LARRKTGVRNGGHKVETSPKVSDQIKTTTCYMCACRCGIKVHLLDGQIRYIEGNPDHPVNKGVLCAKGSAGIMQQNSPAKLRKPLKRVGPRGEGPFEEIEWDEALNLATTWLGDIRKTDPRKLAFFTGRDQSQAFTGWWASQFGTPNYAAHGGFCSVNMATAGLYSIGGSFWEFGEPDWERTRYFLMFGVAEDHDSNPIKTGIAELKARGAKFVSINPVRTGYSAVADEWVPIRPGTDGLLVMALAQELIKSGRVDYDWLARYTNAPWLVIDAPKKPNHGTFARDADGHPLAIDGRTGKPANALRSDIRIKLSGTVEIEPGISARPAFELLVERCMETAYSPEVAAARTGVPAAAIRRIARELAEAAFDQEIQLEQPWTDWAGRHHTHVTGRPVSMHAMRGISAHSNGFHTCRAIHILQMLLGAIDCPGGFRYKPPFPRPCPPPLTPAGKVGEVTPNSPMAGTPLGFPTSPGNLLVDDDGKPLRIDKAFSWEAPLAAHGMMHMVIANAHAGDPYPIDTLFMFMANMSWNSSMNTTRTMEMLTDRDAATGEYRIPHIIYSDAYASEMVAYADLILPDTTYLERHDSISLLDRPISSAEGPGDAIRHPVLTPDRDVRPFQDVLIDLGQRLGLPGLVTPDGTPRYPGGYPDYIVNHERRPGLGLLAGWRGADGKSQGRGAPNPDQLERYKENGSFWSMKMPPHMHWNRHGNGDYLTWAKEMGFIDSDEQIVLQIYSEPLQRFRQAARGHGPYQPPSALRPRIETYFDPLPIWYPPLSQQPGAQGGAGIDDFPLHAITQRPMAMYHSWGSQNAWLRQIHGANAIYLHHATAEALGIKDGDWIWVESPSGRVKGQARPMDGVERHTVWTWNAIAKRRGSWNLNEDAPEATRAVMFNHLIPEFLPNADNSARLSNSDPITGQAAWFDLRVRIRKALPEEAGIAEPQFPPLPSLPGLDKAPSILRYGEAFHGRSKPLRRTGPGGGS